MLLYSSSAAMAEVVIGEDHEQTGIDREAKSSQKGGVVVVYMQ